MSIIMSYHVYVTSILQCQLEMTRPCEALKMSVTNNTTLKPISPAPFGSVMVSLDHTLILSVISFYYLWIPV